MLSPNELCGARHDEQRVAILFDFRPLMGVVRVLDGEIVQFELPLHAAQKRHIRLVQPDPDHMARLAAPTRGFLNGDVGDAPAVDIDAGRDDPSEPTGAFAPAAVDAKFMVSVPQCSRLNLASRQRFSTG